MRADRQGLRKVIEVLHALDYSSSGQSPDGHAYRFERSSTIGVSSVDLAADGEEGPNATVAVDLLVPEGLGSRADIRTIGSATAFSAPGISQALDRTELVPVRHSGAPAWVPRPSLLGAIVGKAVAALVDPVDSERHVADFAFLCGLVTDPFALAGEVTRKDRERLRAAAAKLISNDPAWDPAVGPSDAQVALTILIGD